MPFCSRKTQFVEYLMSNQFASLFNFILLWCVLFSFWDLVLLELMANQSAARCHRELASFWFFLLTYVIGKGINLQPIYTHVSFFPCHLLSRLSCNLMNHKLEYMPCALIELLLSWILWQSRWHILAFLRIHRF